MVELTKHSFRSQGQHVPSVGARAGRKYTNVVFADFAGSPGVQGVNYVSFSETKRVAQLLQSFYRKREYNLRIPVPSSTSAPC